jgi:hypothetical protein
VFPSGRFRRPARIVKAADAAIFFVARRHKFVHRSRDQRGQVTPHRGGHGRHRQIGMALGAPRRLDDYLVDDSEAGQVASGQPESASRRTRARAVAPEDRRAAFRRDHRIDGLVQHQEDVADADGECAPAATLSRDHRHDRSANPGHDEQGACDGLALSPFFRLLARRRSLSIDQRDQWKAQLFGEPHNACGLAVPLRMRAAEISLDVLPRVAPFGMADQSGGPTVHESETGDDRRVVAEPAVPMKLDKLAHQCRRIIHHLGPGHISSQLHRLPRGGVAGDLFPQRARAGFEGGDLRRQVQLTVGGGDPLEVRELALHLGQGALQTLRLRFVPGA